VKQLFTPQSRDKAIETTCCNLVMAGLLLHGEESKFMADTIIGYTDAELTEILCRSKRLLAKYLEQCWSLN